MDPIKFSQKVGVTSSERKVLPPGTIILGELTLPSPTTQTTVGAAGSASAIPAQPTGYLMVTIGNAQFVIPYYAAS